ncbi:MAG: hypothetical protein JW940_26530, partial [Polyangiaceae bacterium]|nr:hypothetical protein [Polyangiaceae bacterium]
EDPSRAALAQHLERVMAASECALPERRRMVELMALFATLPVPPDPLGLYPDYAALRERFLRAVDSGVTELVEESFLALYSHLHGYEVPLTPAERRRFRAKSGYLCHVGGLSPIVKSAPYISADTVAADYGAGNGLQGLLMQVLSPHRMTVQIELSSLLLESGRQLQAWLGVPKERVRWVAADVADVSPAEMDFIYIYRPLRPEGEGRLFYQRFARALAVSDGPCVIFSVADCLRGFLPQSFEAFYEDGHLTCYRKGR